MSRSASSSPLKSPPDARLRQTDLHDLFERQVAKALVGAALRGDLEFHRPPRGIARRDRYADAHEVAKGFALSQKLVFLQLAARNLDFGERFARLRGNPETVAVQVVAFGDSEFDLDVLLVERAGGNPERLLGLEYALRREELRRRGARRKKHRCEGKIPQHPLPMKLEISSGAENTTCARSPCIPWPTRTGLPGAGPLGPESVLKRKLNSQKGSVAPLPVVRSEERRVGKECISRWLSV